MAVLCWMGRGIDAVIDRSFVRLGVAIYIFFFAVHAVIYRFGKPPKCCFRTQLDAYISYRL